MAARKTTTNTATTQAAPDAVAVDGVGPDAEAATPAPTDVTPETAGADTREDARLAKLAALAGGAEPAPAEGVDARPEPPLDAEAHPEDQDVDAGGDARRVVLFDWYRVRVDADTVVEARRGQVIRVTGAEARRGEDLGGLGKLNG
nr:MAG TPA: hypothetical protein [Caudoviricetes sp.]